MVIDVISYSDEQLAALTEEQILEVRSVQLKVNKLRKKKEALKADGRFRLLNRGILRSSMAERLENGSLDSIDEEIAGLRDGLLFYLRFSKVNEEGAVSGNVPYDVNYSLTYEERYYAVRDYYQENFTDGTERFNAFKADEFAPIYLGELYKVLYDYFLADVPKD